MSNACTPQYSCCTESCSPASETPCAPGQTPVCPVEMTVDRWSGAFCQAMTEVQVAMLRKRIEKAWGPQMEQVADAMVEAMGVKWQNLLTGAKSQLDLRDKIKDIFVGE